ncbi:tail-specific protease, periplasmic [Teredinibacter turnerae T7901]|uniref:Tail-specific protease, periplasmic n=1 Tax=Teredinibacter turnerae (strain ATCC 39867 / T7901) TaxID=377629 RepID=C5BJD3_TERTT|nr:carboxy terminal-processing peptidase [Teredinibacter turnerae]ACR11047.1 tail-specific protease, periplasmic [Teredinibacter turnerae T7901]
MPSIKTLSRFLLISLLFSSVAWATIIPPLQYTEKQSETLKEVISRLHSHHYRDQPVDDALSQKFLAKYLETLDPARMFFYAKDVEGFEKNATKFDDYFRKGDLGPGFDIYHTYRQRLVSRLEQIIDLLEDDSVTFRFDQNDSIVIDREEMPWPNTRAEADDLWFKRIKLSLLNLKLAGKTVAEARETVARRYKNQLTRIKQQDGTDVFETMVNALTMLYDPHTNYWSERTSKNFDINMSLSLEGIGAVLQSEDEFTKVVRLVPGGPADKQGQLKAADRVVGVGQGSDGELVDIVGWRLDEVVNMIRSPKNTTVRLEVLPSDAPANGETQIISIRRGKVKLEDQAAKKAVMELGDGDTTYKIGVIHLPAFYIDFQAQNNRDPNYKSSKRDVARLLDELSKENVDGVILDLRNNGGGSLYEATMLTDLFIDQGPVVQIRTPDNRINRHHSSNSKARYRGPLIVLVNRLSASASEIFAGAIQDYQRGLIVGSQSFGKGTVQSVTDLLEGKLKITESKFYRVSGDSTQHRGVIPDISLPVMIDTDEVGESAYENALPWDQIHEVPHARYYNFQAFLPELIADHDKRVKTDPDFNFILDQIAMMAKNKDKKSVSLNEKSRIAEKETLEREAMDIDNKRRIGKHLQPYKTLEEYRSSEVEEQDDEQVAQNQYEIDVDGDTLLIETGNIMVDMIRILSTDAVKQASNF